MWCAKAKDGGSTKSELRNLFNPVSNKGSTGAESDGKRSPAGDSVVMRHSQYNAVNER
jgi:hypothetical protein